MRAELAQAERDLAAAGTQEGRTAALLLACTLREELGRLARHNRCAQRVTLCCTGAPCVGPPERRPYGGWVSQMPSTLLSCVMEAWREQAAHPHRAPAFSACPHHAAAP